MKYEKSCGAVVYRWHQNTLEFMILHMQRGHFSLPKGHVEPGESERQTARREILEETGAHVVLHFRFRHVVTYSPFPHVTKDVVFFLARYRYGTIVPQLEEVQAIHWLPVDEAIAHVSYPTDQHVLRLAAEFLTSK